MNNTDIKKLLEFIEAREDEMYALDSSPYALIDEIKEKLNELIK